ncbi:PTS sugar transporter subunit IIA [Salinispirillum marinum]|uniref:PTS sugar transporter subunit IIA n=2 Tax=Saccharospirillaceae TaxID=255527 RepID=A0ABV8BBB1_9GAMM
MPNLNDVVSLERTLWGAPSQSKKKTLQLISDHVVTLQPEFDADALFNSLIERERLGSTGFGNGVAIPHCRLENCAAPFGLLVKLEEPIEFDALDQKPVDIVFTLIVPQEARTEHLQLLSRVAERFNDDARLKAMRQAPDAHAFYAAFIAE